MPEKSFLLILVLVALIAAHSFAQAEPVVPAPITNLPSGNIMVRRDAGLPDGEIITRLYTLEAMDEPLVETETGSFSSLFSTPLPEPALEHLIPLRRLFWGADFSDPDAVGTRIERIEVISPNEREVVGAIRRIATAPVGSVFFVFTDRDVKITGTHEGDDEVGYFDVYLKQGWNQMVFSSSEDPDKGSVQRFASAVEHAIWFFQPSD